MSLFTKKEAMKAQADTSSPDNQRGGGRINFKAVFTGHVMLKPLWFNPSKEKIIALKGLSENAAQYVQEPEYTKVEDQNGNLRSTVSLLCSFNPYAPNHPEKTVELTDKESLHGTFGENNTVLVYPEKRIWPDTIYVDYRINLRNTLRVSGAGKCFVMDDKLVSAWVTMAPTDDIQRAIKNARAGNLEQNGGTYRSLFDINEKTARVLYNGEYDLYSLLFAMAGRIERFRAAENGQEAKGLQGDFFLGESLDKASKAYMDIFNGGQRVLNNIFTDKDQIAYRDDNGNVLKFGALLVANESEKDGNIRCYQEILTSANRDTTCQYDRRIAKGKDTWLGKDIVEGVLQNVEYPYKNKFTFGFQEHKSEADEIESTMRQAAASKSNTTGVAGAAMDDDLPW